MSERFKVLALKARVYYYTTGSNPVLSVVNLLVTNARAFHHFVPLYREELFLGFLSENIPNSIHEHLLS